MALLNIYRPHLQAGRASSTQLIDIEFFDCSRMLITNKLRHVSTSFASALHECLICCFP